MKRLKMIFAFNNKKEQITLFINYLLVLFVFYFPIASMYTIENLNFMDYFTNIFILLALFIGLTLKKVKFLFNNKLFLSIIAIGMLLVISFMWSEPHSGFIYENSEYYKKFLKSYFLLPFLIIVFALKKEFIPILINAFLVSMFVNEIISYGIYFEFWDTWAGSPSNPVPYHLNHITYSTYVGFSILLSLYKLLSISNRYLQSFYAVFFVTMSINLFMSAGRTGQMSLLITSVLLIFIYFKRDIKKLIKVILTLFLIFIIMYNTVNTFNERIHQMITNITTIFENQEYDTSFGTRIMAFTTIPYLMNTDNIIIGVGIGDKPSYISSILNENYPYRLNSFDIHGYLHNSHIEMLVSNGIIGFFIYMLIFYFLIKLQIKDKFIKYLSYVISFYFFCYGLSADIFFFHHVTLLFSCMLAIVVSQVGFENIEKK